MSTQHEINRIRPEHHREGWNIYRTTPDGHPYGIEYVVAGRSMFVMSMDAMSGGRWHVPGHDDMSYGEAIRYAVQLVRDRLLAGDYPLEESDTSGPRYHWVTEEYLLGPDALKPVKAEWGMVEDELWDP